MAATQANMFHLLCPFGATQSVIQNRQPSTGSPKKINTKKSTLPLKWDSSTISSNTHADIFVLLLQFLNSSDDCVLRWLKSQKKPPAHDPLLLFHMDSQTLAVSCWKECLTVLWNNLSINQTLPLVRPCHCSFFEHCALSTHWLTKKPPQSSKWSRYHSPIYKTFTSRVRCSKLNKLQCKWLDAVEETILFQNRMISSLLGRCAFMLEYFAIETPIYEMTLQSDNSPAFLCELKSEMTLPSILLWNAMLMWQLINVFCSCEGLVTDFNIELQVFIDTQPSVEIKRIMSQ